MKHHYTNELELKSLLIRIKKTRICDGTVKSSQTNARTDKETITKNKISLRLLNVCAYISSAFFSYVALTGLTLRGQFLHRSKLLC